MLFRNNKNTLLNNIEKEIICPICREYYNENNFIPLVYNCGHNICMKCFFAQAYNKFTLPPIHCPVCKKLLDNQPIKNTSLLVLMSNSLNITNKLNNDKKSCKHKDYKWNPFRAKCNSCNNKHRSCFQCTKCKDMNICLNCNLYDFTVNPVLCPCGEYLDIENSSLLNCSKCNLGFKGIACGRCLYKLCANCISNFKGYVFEEKGDEIFIGTLIRNKMVGKAIYINYLKGFQYLGEYRSNKRHGFGTQYYYNDAYYKGTWKDDLMDGHGMLCWSKEQYYTGEFENNQANGSGKLRYKNGKIYEGEFLNFKRHGKGTVTYIDGTILQGSFKNDLKNGYCCVTYNSGRVMKGICKNNQKIGKWRIEDPNGSKSIAIFKNNVVISLEPIVETQIYYKKNKYKSIKKIQKS